MLANLLAVLVLLSWHAPPQQQGGASRVGQRREAPQRGSDSLPVSVKLMNTGQSAADSAQHAQEVEQSRVLGLKTLELGERTYRLNVALIFASAITLVALVFQSVWLRRDVTHGEKATHIDLRAYLSVEKVVLSHVWPEQVPTADITIENTGRTPASQVQIESRIVLGVFPKAGKWSPPPPTPGGSLHGLGADKICSSHKELSAPLTVDEFTSLQKSEAALYIDGRIEYRDVFGAPQYANFHFFYNAEGGLVGVATEPVICADGNDAS